MGNDDSKQIIKQLCKDILLPLGVFQKGTSGTYIDDNGYFFTVIEFQPSGFGNGMYLNVALHFLWNEREHLAYDFPFGQDVRVKGFLEYRDQEQFVCEAVQYVQEAASLVCFYRELRDIAAAKRYAQKWLREYKGNSAVGKLDMFHRLDDEDTLQSIRRARAFWRSKSSMKKMNRYEKYDG